MAGIEFRPMGDRAVLVCGMTDPAAWALSARKLHPANTAVAAAETVLVRCDSPAALARLAPALESIDGSVVSVPSDTEKVEIPVVYDGPDLDDVARAIGRSVDEVIALHTGATYTVAFCGFAPGFAYLRGLARELIVPRRATPRTSVAAGSVAVASEFSAVYPRSSPGGWNLLGSTSATLFDPNRASPALLHPGDSVRFVSTTSLQVDLPVPSVASRPIAATEPGFTVIAAGVAATIQDAGRPGYADLGVSPAGMVDPTLGSMINRFVGNRPDAALIETCGGLVIRADRPLVVASTETTAPMVLAAGERFTVRGGGGRLWHYLAIRGGVVADPALSSMSTDTLSGLGPLPIAARQAFAVGPDPATAVADASPVPDSTNIVRVFRGPRLDWFTDGTFELLGSSTVRVTQASRVGVRLTGPKLTRTRHDELPSEGLMPGAIQVPPSGELVMMLADHPTTGGYPVVAVVHHDDVHKVAQHQTIEFVAAS